MSTTLVEYTIEVKRKSINDEDVWYATLADGTKFEASNETDLRTSVRSHILADASKKTCKSVDELDVRMRRTWHVRVVEAEAEASATEEVVWDLFA